jgi:steroid delta-isomerase-like uncharacterized protein
LGGALLGGRFPQRARRIGDGLGAVAHAYTRAFPDLRIEVKYVRVSGDTSIAEFAASGTHRGGLEGVAPTGKRVSMPVCNVIELREGKLYREREYFDVLSLMQQLDAVPASSQAG